MLMFDDIQDSLLYDAEWWLEPPHTSMTINHDDRVATLFVEYGYGEEFGDSDELSYVALLIREAIK